MAAQGGQPERVVYELSAPMYGTHTFVVDARYQLTRLLGRGACGVVAEALDTATGELVAVKKLHSLFHNAIDAKRGLRELRIVRSLVHDNILSVRDIMTIPREDMETFDAIYLVTELMDADLAQIISSDQVFSDLHLAYFMYQLAKAMVYLHSANVLHRDLKPANCLLNKDSMLKVADFGLAKSDAADNTYNPAMTAYVVTRWYRAPEVILDRTSYGKAVDMWALGTILGELLAREPLLPGKNERHQIKLILDLTGPPPPEVIAQYDNPAVREFLTSYDAPPKQPFSTYFPDAHPMAIDLLEALLTFDPAQRLTAIDMLDHPFLADVRDTDTEFIAEAPLDMGIDYYTADMSIPTIRQLMFNEMLFFHPELGNFDDSILGPLDLDPYAQFYDDAAYDGTADMALGTPIGGSSSSGMYNTPSMSPLPRIPAPDDDDIVSMFQ